MEMPDYEAMFKIIKFNFWLIGIPFGDVKINFRYFILFVSLLLMIIGEASFLFSKLNSVNFLDITQLAPCTCIGILSCLKIVAVFLKRKKIFELTESLSVLYKSINICSEKGPIIRSQIVLLTKLAHYFFLLNALLISVYNFSSPVIILYYYLKFDEVPFVLPYQVLLPFKINSWLLWGLIYVYSVICGFICVVYFTTTDVLYSALTTHICANFIVISSKVQNLNKNNVGLLRDIIKDHQYILKLSEELEDIFTAPNLFNVLVGSVIICALGFNLAMGELKQIPGCILFLASVLLQILMMSIFGENIITEVMVLRLNMTVVTLVTGYYCIIAYLVKTFLVLHGILPRCSHRNLIRIGEVVWFLNQYNWQKWEKSSELANMSSRSGKPARLTAYKFSVISYGSFCTILSTSWSYFTILRTVYTPPEVSHN